eukprot:5014061-Lingulodinium_polyedra.AAC.1
MGPESTLLDRIRTQETVQEVPDVARGANCEALFTDHSPLWNAWKADAERGEVLPFHNMSPVETTLVVE